MSDPVDKFASLAMYGDQLEAADPEHDDSDGDRGEPLWPEDSELSEESDESDSPDENDVGYDAPKEGNEPDEPDDLAVALQSARQEIEAAQQRAAHYEAQLAHIAGLIQRPAHTTSYDELSDDELSRWEGEAARRGSDPRTEYRLWQDREEQRQAYEQATLSDSIRGYFASHADHSEYGAAVMKMLDSDPVQLTPFLPPEHAMRDAAWRIDAMFAKAKLQRVVDAKKAEATRAHDDSQRAQRERMKAATRGEPTRQSGVNMGTADSKTSRRTYADEIKAGVKLAAKKSGSILDF